MFQEYAIKFEKTKKGYSITEVIEEKDCYNTIEEFEQSLRNDDTIKSWIGSIGKYRYEDAKYDVYYIIFNDCEECSPVFIGIKEIHVIAEYNKSLVSKRIKGLRLTKGFTQTQLANEIKQLIGREMKLNGDNGKQTISQLENGSRNLTMNLAFAYCEIFNVDLDYLFCRE